MKIYLDTSVINVYLFGKFSDVDRKKVPQVSLLFKLINAGKIHAVISLYTIQEVFVFCKKIFGSEAGNIARRAISELFDNEFVLTGLLMREDRLLHRARFDLDDLSDQPHAISAYLNECDAIISYDSHFQKIKDKISVYTPEDIVSKF